MEGAYNPCPDPNGTPDCPLFYSPGSCRTNIHHEFFPANDYKTPLERAFRDLPENKSEMCLRLHREVHSTEQPPDKPSGEVMLEAITRNVEEGNLVLSATRRRKIYGSR